MYTTYALHTNLTNGASKMMKMCTGCILSVYRQKQVHYFLTSHTKTVAKIELNVHNKMTEVIFPLLFIYQGIATGEQYLVLKWLQMIF